MEDNLTVPQNPIANAIQKAVAIDAKLTRQEAMDLLMDDLLQEMRQERASAEAELAAANAALRNDLTFADAARYLPAGSVRIVSDYSAADHKHTHRLRVEVAVPQDDAKMQAMLQRADAAEAARASINGKIYLMESSKSAFKSTVLRNMLSNTPEGRDVLASLTSVKLAIKAQLLAKREG